MKEFPQTLTDLGFLQDGDYKGYLQGVEVVTSPSGTNTYNFNVFIPFNENGIRKQGHISKIKSFAPNGLWHLKQFLIQFNAIREDNSIDWDYFEDNKIAVYVTLETNDNGGQYITGVTPQYEDYEEDEFYEDE